MSVVRKMMKDINKRPSYWMPIVGDIVDYHSVIGEEITEYNMKVRAVGELAGGEPVAWLDGKPGCVSMDALTPSICDDV